MGPVSPSSAAKPAAAEKLKLSNYLGILRDDPGDEAAFEGLRELAETREPERLGEQPVRLLEVARQAHEARGELAAVAKLLEIEALLIDDDPDFAASLWRELGRVRSESLLDPSGAIAAYRQALSLRSEDRDISDAVSRLEQQENSWRKFAKRFVEEAESATDVSLKTSLLVRAAALIWQYKKKGRDSESDKLFRAALEAEPTNLRAALLYEHTLRERQRWDTLAEHLLEAADNARDNKDQIGFFSRAARVLSRRLEDDNRAAACYERVLDLEPGNAEAMAYLSEYFAKHEQWDHLVAMYEDALRVRHKLDVEVGILLQISMVHWRMRQRPDDAELYFARLRKLDPVHPAVLDFYRQYLTGPDQVEQLVAVLSDAQRITSDERQKLDLAVELATAAQQAGLSERAIDGWKLVQRLDPRHPDATRTLRSLYHAAEKWNALVDIIKAELEATPEDQVDRKVSLLRELLSIYRDRLRMDGMVINTLNRIMALQPGDRETVGELVGRFEGAGRWNDLINVLAFDAEHQSDPASKVEALLKVARLWIDHFSNYNQATAPLEKVLEIDPENREALFQLKEIYEKKRAWKQLFEVLRKERGVVSDPAVRLNNTIEMARLSSDRLQGYGDAIVLWKEALEQDAAAPGAIEALEKLCEREKDWKTLGEVLELDLSRADNDEARIRILQKLAGLHGERLADAEAAAVCWRRILAIEPRHGRAVRALRDMLLERNDWDGLEALYGEIGDWEALTDVLSGEADNASEPELKQALSFRVARIFEQEINEPVRAVRSYERVLSVDPDNLGAAKALLPIYTQEEKWPRCRAMLELILAGQSDTSVAEKLSLLGQLRELCATRLRDGEAAFGYAVRAFQLAPDDDAVRASLEASAEAAAAYPRVVELYRARAGELDGSGDSVRAVALHRRVAQLSLDRLSDDSLGAAELEKVLAARPDDGEVMAALERLYRAYQNTASLRDLLDHRLRHGDEPEERVIELLEELAHIEEDAFGDPLAGAVRYRELHRLRPDEPSFLQALDRLALAAERWTELSEVLEKRRDLEADQRTEMSGRLGLLLLDKLDQPGPALDAFVEVVENDPTHAPTGAALERLMADADLPAEHRLRVMELLERVYEQSGRYDKLLAILEQHLARERDEDAVRMLRLRIAEISASKLGDTAGAYGALETAFLESPTDRSLWERVAEAAENAGQQRALAHAYATAIEAGRLDDADSVELATRVARIYDEVLNQPDEAEPFHKRVIAHDPLDDAAFSALKELYTTVERWDELQALYRKRIADTTDVSMRLELLLQVCFLLEEILDRPDQAIESYQQVLQLEPNHPAARRTLEKLYEGTERWRDLAELLAGNLDQAEGQERIDLMFRLGELYEAKLANPAAAVDQYEGVLSDQPHHLRAQEALARLLGVEGQRQRVATLLEPIYESQGAWAELARVLEIQLDDMETEGGRADLLLRIGELHEQRTRDPDATFGAYARAVEVDPGNATAREALERTASQREVYRRQRAEVLERALAKVEADAGLQSELLLELAVLLDEYLNDREAAERAYTRLIEVDPENGEVVLVAARALERLHLAREDYTRLAVDLQRQIQFETDVETRASLLLRLGEMYENMLEDADGAIGAHRQRLELDAGDVDALRSLERLFERGERWSELCDVLRAHADQSDDDEERRALGRRAAGLREERLEDLPGAIDAYNEVLTAFGPDRDTLAALARLYERSERYQELLDCQHSQEDLARDDGERTALRFAMGELLRQRLADPERAIECYGNVLEFDPAHSGALAALDAIMGAQDEEHRAAAARVAAPRYEAVANFERLLPALEVLAQTDDPPERLSALRRSAEVHSAMGNPSLAFDAMARAVRAGIGDPTLVDLLAELARLAEGSGRWEDYALLQIEIAPEIFDGDLQCEVYRRLARVARQHLADFKLAIEYFEKLRSERPDDVEALDALEQLNEQTGQHQALIEILKQKAELSRDPAARKALLTRQADIYENRLDDADNAIEVLEALTVESPAPEAYQALERLYVATARFADLGAMYEQQLDRQIGRAVDLRYKLARNCREHLDETDRALEYLRDALTDDVHHQPSVALLETIMADEGPTRAAAAEILEPGYLARMEWPKLTGALEARIEGEVDADERRRLLERLAQIYEDQLEDFDGALGIYARLFAEDPRVEDTWETLFRLAKVGEQWERLGGILAEPIDKDGVDDEAMARLAKTAGRLYTDRLGQRERAADLFAKALAFDARDEQAFLALEAAYRANEAYDQLLPLYREQADGADGDERRVALLHKRGEIFRDVRKDAEQAIQTYREILEVDPTERRAIGALEALLAEGERWQELSEHLQMRIDQSLGTPDEVTLKLRLGQLLEEKLGSAVDAIGVYEDVFHVDADNPQAIAALERLVQAPEHLLRITHILEPIYRQLDQWKKLVAIFEAQIEVLEDDAEAVRLLSEIGELHEARGRDVALALHAWMRAFVREPDNEFARSHVDRLAAQMGAWDEHVESYEQALTRTDDPATVSSLLTTLARVHDERRGDPRTAIAVYERLAKHDPDDPVPLEALEALHTMVGDWEGLCRALERKVEQAFSREEKGELLRRIGSVREELLGDPDAAIAAYVRATEEDDADELAYEALDALYTRTQRYKMLASVLTRRVELANDAQTRVEVGLRAGRLLDGQLHQPEQAIEAYERVLDDDPKSVQALLSQAVLYERQAMWPELLENLTRQAELVPDEPQRVGLRHRAGGILERELGDVFEAIERYREALDGDPTHAPSIDALMRISRQPEHRERAASIVEPLLRSQERWDDVVTLLSQGLDVLVDPVERRSELQRLAAVHEQGRGDPAAAFNTLCDALAADPGDETVLEELERLAGVQNAWRRLADVLAERAQQAGDPMAASRLYRRLATICEGQVGDDARAIDAYVHASEYDDDASETLVDLDRLYLKTERWPELVDVLDRRIAAAMDPGERTDLLIRLGTLRQERFDDGHGAFIAYKEVLERDPGEARALEGMEQLGRRDELARDALDVLDECYRQTGALDKVAGLYDIKIRLAETDAERVRLLGEAADVWERDLSDAPRALGYARRMFEIDPGSDAALDETVRLADVGGAWEGLRGMVEGLIERSAVEGQRKKQLSLVAAEWYRDRLAAPAAEEQCLRWALEVDSTQIDVHERLVDILRAPGREADLVAALRALADAESDTGSRIDRLREAGKLSESALSDPEGAAECYVGLLGADPEDREALEDLGRIRMTQGRHREAVGLMERRLSLELDASTRLSLRYMIAETWNRELSDPGEAIVRYQALLDEAPDEHRAVEALDGLLSQSERWDELKALLETQLERADDPAVRTELRVRLAGLLEQQLGDIDQAIAELNSILQDQPGHARALDELERLYLAGKRFTDLCELLRERAEHAAAHGDAVQEVAVLHRIAQVQRDELDDAAEALETYQRIAAKSPEDRGALEALAALNEAAEDYAQVVRHLGALLQVQPPDHALATAHKLARIADERLGELDSAERALLHALALVPGHGETRDKLKALYEKYGAHAKLAALLSDEEQATDDATAKVALLNRIAGLYLNELADPAGAVAYLEKAVALMPEDREALLALCDIYIAANRQRDAVPVLEKIIESYGGRRAKEVAVYQHRLGRAHEGLGDLAEAMKCYDAAFKIDLTNVQILRDLGRLCMQRGDLERAQKSYRALLLQKLGPEAGIQKADVYFHLGEISFQQGDKIKAKAMLERAVAEAGEHAQAQELLGQL